MDPKELAAFLKDLLRAPGLSAREGPVREQIRQAWAELADQIEVSRLGSLHALRRGTGTAPRPKVMLAAHMDTIGLLVRQIVDGFLRIDQLGGVDPRILPGQRVVIHGRRDLPGLVVHPPQQLLPPERDPGAAVRLEDLWVDAGLASAELDRLVRVGDPVSFAQPPLEIGKDLLAGKSLDDRAGVAALTLCLSQLQARPHWWDVIAVASVQEEETFAGARTSAFALRPDLAVAVDVTFASGLAGQPEEFTFALGGGPTLELGPNVHPGVFRAFEAAAKACEIPTRSSRSPVTREPTPTRCRSPPRAYPRWWWGFLCATCILPSSLFRCATLSVPVDC